MVDNHFYRQFLYLITEYIIITTEYNLFILLIQFTRFNSSTLNTIIILSYAYKL